MTDQPKSGKRKTWRDRKCGHGNRVEWRTQLDIVTCVEPGCFDLAFARLGYVPGPELLAARKALSDAS